MPDREPKWEMHRMDGAALHLNPHPSKNEGCGTRKFNCGRLSRAEGAASRHVHAGSRTEVGDAQGGWRGAASKPAPFKKRRVRHPEIQLRSFEWCERVGQPPGSRTEVGDAQGGWRDAASKPAPFKKRRVRHPEIQLRSFEWCGRVGHPPAYLVAPETRVRKIATFPGASPTAIPKVTAENKPR